MALVRKELIRPDESQLAGEDGFSFRHILIRDAAYEALPMSVRAELHEHFAHWLDRRQVLLSSRSRRSPATTSSRPFATASGRSRRTSASSRWEPVRRTTSGAPVNARWPGVTWLRRRICWSAPPRLSVNRIPAGWTCSRRSEWREWGRASSRWLWKSSMQRLNRPKSTVIAGRAAARPSSARGSRFSPVELGRTKLGWKAKRHCRSLPSSKTISGWPELGYSRPRP